MSLPFDDPSKYFNNSSRTAHHIPRQEQEALQLQMIHARFGIMRDALPALKALADHAQIDEIRKLEDVAPLLYPHSFYKSYPEHVLEYNDFPKLTRWLSRLTLLDLSAVAGKNFDSIDAWCDAIEDKTDALVLHSSGTAGRLSLYPRGKVETETHRAYWKMLIPEWVEPLDFSYADMNFAVIWPSYASGRSAILRMGELCRDAFAPSPDDFFPLLPAEMSADWQYWLMRVDNARRHGRVPPTPSPYVATKMAENDDFNATLAERTNVLLDMIRDRLQGQRSLLTGGVQAVYKFAAAGVARGMTPGFAPGSAVRLVGGLKGFAAADDMEATMKRFAGTPAIINSYGMSELGVGFSMCRHGRYHVPPWIIPYVFDVESGELRPRKAVQRGQAAFFDLAGQSFWCGVISGDMIEIDWDFCKCGRTTPHIHQDIDRLPAPFEGDHLMGAATSAAIQAAVAALNA